MKIFISGCYGTGNVGDEAILESLIKLAREKYDNGTIVVSSIDPERTRAIHSADKVVPTIERDPLKWINSIRSIDCILLGGGSLLGGDFIYRHSIIVSLANLFQIPVGYVAVGTTYCENETLRSRLIQNLDFITVRDAGTAQYVSQYLPADVIHEVADPAFYLGDYPRNEMENKNVIICGKYVSRGDSGFDIDGLVQALNNIDEYWNIEFLPCNYHSDRPFCFEVSEQLSRDSKVIDRSLTHVEFQEKISKAKLVVGVRLHSVIMAIRASTPFVGISYHPKCTNILKHYGIDIPHTFDDIDPQRLYSDISSELNDEGDSYLEEYSIKQSQRAKNIYNIIDEEIQEKSVNRISRLHFDSLINGLKYMTNT